MFNINSVNKIEREFEIAKAQGRWLSDEERKELERREKIRSKLVVLTGICILLPPLWPFAFGLSLYLLFPKTITNVGVVATVIFLLASFLLTSALIFLVWSLINTFFQYGWFLALHLKLFLYDYVADVRFVLIGAILNLALNGCLLDLGL